MGKATGRPVGRPRIVLSEKELQTIEQLSGYGLTVVQISAVVGISERRLRQKNNQDPINAAFARGRAKSEAIIGKSLFEKAREGDVNAIRWFEMTRAGRSEKQRVEASVSGPGGGPIKYEVTRTVVDVKKNK